MNNPNLEVVKNENNENETKNKPVDDAMTFMNEEEMADEIKKDEEFFKAFRFGTSEFFRKVREVYEIEGIAGLKRLELSLDTYMSIRSLVMNEVIESNPHIAASNSEHEHDEEENEESIVFDNEE